MNAQQQDTIARLQGAVEAGPTAHAEWIAKGSGVWIGQRRICSHVTAGESMGMGQAIERERVNAAFIAAANPTAIRSLLDLVREQREALTKARAPIASIAAAQQLNPYGTMAQFCRDSGEILRTIDAALTPEGR